MAGEGEELDILRLSVPMREKQVKDVFQLGALEGAIKIGSNSWEKKPRKGITRRRGDAETRRVAVFKSFSAPPRLRVRSSLLPFVITPRA